MQPIANCLLLLRSHGHIVIDEFGGDNLGLIVAEVELSDPDQSFDRPDWIGEEVTDDSRYFNSNLIAHPYTRWG